MWTRPRHGKYRFGCYCHGRGGRMIRNLHWNRNRNWYLYLFLTNMSDLLLTLIFVEFLLDSSM